MSSRMDISSDQELSIQQQLIHQLRQMQSRLDTQEQFMKEQATTIQNLKVQSQNSSKSSSSNLKSSGHKPREDDIPSSFLEREKLPALEKYRGDRSQWDEWHMTALHKLKSDGKAIGDEFHQFMYIYSRLEGTAAKMVTTTVERLSLNETGKGSEFLTYLNTIFGDANKRARAQRQLYNLKQKEKELFSHFLTTFETVLANAGWSTYEDDQKISLLKNALSKEMQQALVGRKLGPTWEDAISKLQIISSDIASISQQHTPQSSKPLTTLNQSNSRPSLSSEMEWEPTKLVTVNTQGQRATWVSKETLAYRKSKGLCMRCGHKGHITPRCKYLPPQKPTAISKVSVEQDSEEEIDYLAKPEGVSLLQGKEELLF